MQSFHLQASQVTWNSIAQSLTSNFHQADVWLGSTEAIPTIAEVRKLQHFASQTPVKDGKVALLFFADQLRSETSNSLLKILEEPPHYLSIYLLSESGRLLPTIRSRVGEVAPPQTEVTESNETSFTRWRELLTSYTVEDDTQREEVKKLLYRQPLIHSTINQDQLLEAYQHYQP
jgi:hypothetical protein